MDFTSTYSRTAEAVICLTADIGSGIAESTGFLTRIGHRNFIVTTGHSVLKDRNLWDMSQMMFQDDGTKGCGTWKSTQVELPIGVQKVIFRYVAGEITTKSAFIDNVVIRTSNGILFRDNFNQSILGSSWSQGLGEPWVIAKNRGRLFSTAVQSGQTTDLSTLVLQINTNERSTLQFDYKVDCQGGSFLVGYCLSESCGRISDNILGYYHSEIHPLKVVGLDGKGDIALCLPSDGSSLEGLSTLAIVNDNHKIPIASPIAIIGNPLGLNNQSIATGVLRDNNYVLPNAQTVASVLTSTASFAGNSGSPYILTDGRVVGMNTYGIAVNPEELESTLNGGPSAQILNKVITTLAAQITDDNKTILYQKAYLGLQLLGIDISVIGVVNLPMIGSNPLFAPQGFLITQLESDSPLKGHVQQFDVLLTLQGVILGTFPRQASPSEVTWFMALDGQVDITLLRFSSQTGWSLLALNKIPLKPFPLLKDVPLGPTLRYLEQGSRISITYRKTDGARIHQNHSLSPSI